MEQPGNGEQPAELDYLLPGAGAGGHQDPAAGSSNGAPSVRGSDQGANAANEASGSERSGRRRGDAGASSSGRNRVQRNRAMARVSNAKRKGRIKEMESGLEKTRQKVLELQESIRSLEAENNDLKSLLRQ